MIWGEGLVHQFKKFFSYIGFHILAKWWIEPGNISLPVLTSTVGVACTGLPGLVTSWQLARRGHTGTREHQLSSNQNQPETAAMGKTSDEFPLSLL